MSRLRPTAEGTSTGTRMAPKTRKAAEAHTYELHWQFEPRLVSDHLGALKYSTSARAVGELVANALDAGATRIDVWIEENELGGGERMRIIDNGKGMGPVDLRDRFSVVGVAPEEVGRTVQFGRFGIGRLAVHRIGTLSEWTTVAEIDSGRRVRSMFTLSSSERGPLRIVQEDVPRRTPLGTSIVVHNLLDRTASAHSARRLADELSAQFCGYLLGNTSRLILVQGDALDLERIIESKERESVQKTRNVPYGLTVNHLQLFHPVDRSRFPAQVLFSAKGRTVGAVQPEDPPSPNYLGVAECDYLDSLVTTNRESLVEMDETFLRIKETTLQAVAGFATRLRADQKRRFLERARREDFYPYRHAPGDSVSGVKQQIYDVVLEKVNEHANLEAMTKRQQAIVFRLLDRSLSNENLLEILHEVAALSDEDMEKFRQVLERTTLDSIIRLSSEVTGRLAFLDVLHELVYGDVAKHVKERSQLHKILEPQCWLFGARHHLATSDQSFRSIVRRHRAIAGLEPVEEDRIAAIGGIADIPDLFLAATRDFPTEPRHHHLLVEIKAPSVRLGSKEIEQARRYAHTVAESSEFDKSSTRWDVVLISSEVGTEVEFQRTQKGVEYGCVLNGERMAVWAFAWSEVITRSREEMNLVREHLQRKSQELTVSDYLRENFPEILDDINSMRATEASARSVGA